MTKQYIFVNLDEKTGRFLGAYESKELAFAAMAHALDVQDDPEYTGLTIEYPLISGKIDKHQITVEDILNGKNEE